VRVELGLRDRKLETEGISSL